MSTENFSRFLKYDSSQRMFTRIDKGVKSFYEAFKGYSNGEGLTIHVVQEINKSVSKPTT
jgi:hypothetical protein